MVMIDIGGGNAVAPGCINLDPITGHGEWKRRIQDGIPAADNSVHAVRASHVLEHIPAGQERIDVFNEVHRVLVPGGIFEVILPFFVAGRWEAIADPTHVSFWIEESFHYFDGTKMPCATYGIKMWTSQLLETRGGWEGHWIGVPQK